MTEQERKIQRAKALRVRKPISKQMNLEDIRSEMWRMLEECEDIHWYDGSLEELVDALEGDEDEAYEFKVAFADLEAELEQFSHDIESEYVSQYFDDFFPAIKANYFGGYLGYDSYEDDYFGIEPYEYSFAEGAAAERIMALTKKQILEAAGSCLKIAYSYLSLHNRYDNLASAIDILRGKNLDRLKILKAVEEQYELAEKATDGFTLSYGKELDRYNKVLDTVPREYWVG